MFVFILGVLTILIFIFSLKKFPSLFSNEFVLGIAITSFLIILYLFLSFIFGVKEKINVDELIDRVVYQKYPRKYAYREIQTTRLGYLPIDFLKSKIDNLNILYEDCQMKFSDLKQSIFQIPKQKGYSPNSIELFENRFAYFSKYIDYYKSSYEHLIHIKNEMIDIQNDLKDNIFVLPDEDFQAFVKSINDDIQKPNLLEESYNKLEKEFLKYIGRNK